MIPIQKSNIDLDPIKKLLNIMKKINLNAEDKQHLGGLVASNAPGLGVLKKILKHYMTELQDVRNIDPKGNVGLQTVADGGEIRLLPWLWELAPDDRRYYPIYAKCVELDIPICITTGVPGPAAAPRRRLRPRVHRLYALRRDAVGGRENCVKTRCARACQARDMLSDESAAPAAVAARARARRQRQRYHAPRARDSAAARE